MNYFTAIRKINDRFLKYICFLQLSFFLVLSLFNPTSFKFRTNSYNKLTKHLTSDKS
jgi:hypothetical protein